jgi:ABC-type phosphate transport system auxiliary subunit
LEFHRRHVHWASPDRREFLDVELLAAIREVLGCRPDGKELTESEREALSHPQTLAVLDRLEQRYRREAAEVRKQESNSIVAQVGLADLINRMEKGLPIVSEQVACALYHELEAVNHRLEVLEREIRRANQSRS